MSKIEIVIKDGRPSIKFRGAVSNADIRESIKVLTVYVKPECHGIQNPARITEIDIPLGDCDGEE